MQLTPETIAEISAELKRIADTVKIDGLTDIAASIDSAGFVSLNGSSPSPDWRFYCGHGRNFGDALETLRAKAPTRETKIAELRAQLAKLEAA